MSKLNRVGRLLVGLLGSAIVSSSLIVVFIFVREVMNKGLSVELFQSLPKGFVVFLVAGSFFIGIQSFAYTIVMEFIARPKVRLRYAYLAVSCMLGAASGLVVDLVFDSRPLFVILGTIVGLLTGFILYDKELQDSDNKRMTSGQQTATRFVER